MSILIGNTYYTDISPVMTSNTTPSPYVAECSIVVINALWQAFDGSTDTLFRTNISTVTPFTFLLDYGEGNEQIVNAYRLSCTYNATWSMKSWNFEGSNDKITWDILDSRTDIVWSEQNIQGFAFHNTKKYRYYRFNVLEKNGTNSVCINEIEFLQQESTNIEFRKVLKSNLPSSKTDGVDTVYFTDDGDIYITDKSGNLKLSGVTHISSESDNTLLMKDDGLYVSSGLKKDGDGTNYLTDDGTYKKPKVETLSSDDCLTFIENLWNENFIMDATDETIFISDDNLMQIMNNNNDIINAMLRSLTMIATEKDCDEIIEGVSKIIKRE